MKALPRVLNCSMAAAAIVAASLWRCCRVNGSWAVKLTKVGPTQLKRALSIEIL